MSVHFGQCCTPVPGDRIVGILEPESGLTVHTIDCQTLAAFADDGPLALACLEGGALFDAVERGVAAAAKDGELGEVLVPDHGVVAPFALRDHASIDPEDRVQFATVEEDGAGRRCRVVRVQAHGFNLGRWRPDARGGQEIDADTKWPRFGPSPARMRNEISIIGSSEFGSVPDPEQPPQPPLDAFSYGFRRPMRPPSDRPPRLSPPPPWHARES